MPDPCEFGAEPKPDAPAWFLYTEVPTFGWLLHVAAWLTDQAMGLPHTPQETALFCATAPPTDLPTAADYVALQNPLVSLLTGVYKRFGNQRRVEAFAEYCQCKAPPTVDPDWKFLARLTCASPDADYFLLACTGPLVPQNAAELRVVLEASSATPTAVRAGFWWPPQSTPQQWTNSNLPPGSTVEGTAFGAGMAIGDNRSWSGLQDAPIVDEDLQLVLGFDHAIGSATVRFEYKEAYPVATPYVPPDAPALPDGYPSAPAGPLCDDLADVCRSIGGVAEQLRDVDAKVSWLAALAVPPDALPDPEPIGVPASGATPKPPSAIGCSIAFSVPARLSRWGTAPEAYGGVGWATPVTAWGYLPSIALRHSPLVLLPIAPQVTDVALDLAAGVLAELTWLYPPK